MIVPLLPSLSSLQLLLCFCTWNYLLLVGSSILLFMVVQQLFACVTHGDEHIFHLLPFGFDSLEIFKIECIVGLQYCILTFMMYLTVIIYIYSHLRVYYFSYFSSLRFPQDIESPASLSIRLDQYNKNKFKHSMRRHVIQSFVQTRYMWISIYYNIFIKRTGTLSYCCFSC